jgi:hypothetical protein
MFERAARRGFARTSIRSYQTTVLIESLFLNSLKRSKFACETIGYDTSMNKADIPEELPKPTKTGRQEIRLRLAELDSDDWLDDEEPLTVHEKALLEARLVAYAKHRDAGSTWEEVEGRI